MSDPGSSAERARQAATYGAYRASGRRRRAWSRSNAGNAHIADELAAAIARYVPVGAQPVLDVGCGTGWWLARLIETGTPAARVHGIDLLPERVAAAREAAAGADVRAGDALKLPWLDGSFGLVTLLSVLSSMPDDRTVATAVREAHRVTSPGGILLVWEPRVPTPNPRTIRVRPGVIRAALPAGTTVERSSITLLPQVARRLGPLTGRLYPVLARVPVLRSHALTVIRRAG